MQPRIPYKETITDRELQKIHRMESSHQKQYVRYDSCEPVLPQDNGTAECR